MPQEVALQWPIPRSLSCPLMTKGLGSAVSSGEGRGRHQRTEPRGRASPGPAARARPPWDAPRARGHSACASGLTCSVQLDEDLSPSGPLCARL